MNWPFYLWLALSCIPTVLLWFYWRDEYTLFSRIIMTLLAGNSLGLLAIILMFILFFIGAAKTILVPIALIIVALFAAGPGLTAWWLLSKDLDASRRWRLVRKIGIIGAPYLVFLSLLLDKIVFFVLMLGPLAVLGAGMILLHKHGLSMSQVRRVGLGLVCILLPFAGLYHGEATQVLKSLIGEITTP